MTKPIAMDPEPETIRLETAERLGWTSIEISRDGVLVGMAPGRRVFEAVPSYARDIRAAWMIVDFLSGLGFRVRLDVAPGRGGGRLIAVVIEQGPKLAARAEAPTVGMAVCQAFLQIPNESLTCVRPTAGRP